MIIQKLVWMNLGCLLDFNFLMNLLWSWRWFLYSWMDIVVGF